MGIPFNGLPPSVATLQVPLISSWIDKYFILFFSSKNDEVPRPVEL